MSYPLPHLPQAELQNTDIEFRHVTDWGAPLAGATYKATLSDGSVRTGVLDAQGVARISGVPAETTAKVEYKYHPLQAKSHVDTQLDDDLHELLNWEPQSTDAADSQGGQA